MVDDQLQRGQHLPRAIVQVNTSYEGYKRARTVSCFPSFAASVLTMTFPSCFSAESTLVLSLNLKPCLVNDFWNCFLKIVHGKHQGTDGSRGGKNARDFLVDADASDGAEELNDSHF